MKQHPKFSQHQLHHQGPPLQSSSHCVIDITTVMIFDTLPTVNMVNMVSVEVFTRHVNGNYKCVISHSRSVNGAYEREKNIFVHTKTIIFV